MHNTRNFVRVVVDYLVPESPRVRAMETWPRHINHYEWNYDKEFAANKCFGADITDRTHKQVQVLLYSCNMYSLDNVEMAAPADFGDLQRRVNQGEWIMYTPIWAIQTAAIDEGNRNSEGRGRHNQNNIQKKDMA